MKIALILDSPMRDLPGIVLVGKRLVELGHTVIIVPFNLVPYEIFALAPDFFMMPHLKKTATRMVARMHALGPGFGVLDTEGSAYSSMDFYRNLLTDDADLRTKTTVICAWGRKRVNYCLEQGLFREDQLCLTGSARHDYFHETLKPVALELGGAYVDIPQPMYLVGSNAVAANPQFNSAEGEIRMFREVFKMSEEDVNAFIAGQRVNIGGFVDMANTLATEIDSANLVFRPHPFENLKPYADGLKKRENLTLRLQGTIDQWLLRSRALIQRDSTIALDSVMAETPVLTPDWLPAPWGIAELADVSERCPDVGHMKSVLQEILQGSYSPSAQLQKNIRQVLDDYYHGRDGQSHLRAADAIHLAAQSRGVTPKIDDCLDAMHEWANPEGQFLPGMRSALLKKMHRPPGANFKSAFDNKQRWCAEQWDTSGKSFTLEDVQSILNLLPATGNGGTIACRKASTKSGDYWLEKCFGRSVVMSATA